MAQSKADRQTDLCRDALRLDSTVSRMGRDALHTVGQYGHKSLGGMNRLADAVDRLADAVMKAWAERAADPVREPPTLPELQTAVYSVAYEMALIAQSGSWFLAEDVLDRLHHIGQPVSGLPIDSPLHRIVENRYKQVPTAARAQKAVYELLYVAGKPGLAPEIYSSALETVAMLGVITSAAYAMINSAETEEERKN